MFVIWLFRMWVVSGCFWFCVLWVGVVVGCCVYVGYWIEVSRSVERMIDGFMLCVLIRELLCDGFVCWFGIL